MLVLNHDLSMRTTMGGQSAVDEFVRLFLAPGYAHGEGPGAGRILDLYDVLESWVLENQAPDYLVGCHPYDADDLADVPAVCEFERRLYPFPYTSTLIPGKNATLADSWQKTGPINESFPSWN